MRKKVLVITLALVLAFASSAMATVNFGGKFTFTAQQNSFKLLTANYTLTPGFEFNISASNDNETEDYLNWDFSGDISVKSALAYSEPGEDDDEEDFEPEIIGVNTSFNLGAYQLGLYDNYFDLYVWGNGKKLNTKATSFGMISAGEVASGHRARLVVPVDVATVTLDFEPQNNLRAFVDGEISDFEVGFAYARKGWDEDSATNVLVGQVATSVPAGDLAVDLSAAVGATLGDDTGFAFGVSAEADVTDEINVGASVTTANEDWAGDGVKAKNTVIKADATYTEDNFQVGGDVSTTIVKDVDEKTVTMGLGAKYRMSQALAYNHLFHGEHWFKNDAPAFGIDIDFAGSKFDGFVLNATSPIVDEVAWIWAKAEFADKDDYSAKVLGHVVASDKLTVNPSVEYKKDGKVFDIKLVANYKIGYSDTALSLTAQKVLHEDEDENTELLKASISVPF